MLGLKITFAEFLTSRLFWLLIGIHKSCDFT